MSDTSFRAPDPALRVTTILNFSRAVLDRFNGMVYLYDPGWTPTADPDTADTLPFAFLEVIKESVIQKCEVSKKRLILFEPGTNTEDTQSVAGSARSYRPGVINIVADNIINEPVIHKLECLIPSNMVSSFGERSFSMVDTVLSVSAIGESNSNVLSAISVMQSVLVALGATLRVINRSVELFKSLAGRNNDYNRRSLLLMAKKRAILKYKPWSSWETKTVVISNVETQKIGTEDDYFRATIELEEIPILYVGPVSDSRSTVDTGSRLTGLIKKSFESITSLLEDGSAIGSGG